MHRTACLLLALTASAGAWASFGGSAPSGLLFHGVLFLAYVWGVILTIVLFAGGTRRRAGLWSVTAIDVFLVALLGLVYRDAVETFTDMRTTCIADASDVAAILALAMVPLLFWAPILQRRRYREPELSRRPASLLLCSLALVAVGPFVWAIVPGSARYVLGQSASGQLTLVRGTSICQLLGLAEGTDSTRPQAAR